MKYKKVFLIILALVMVLGTLLSSCEVVKPDDGEDEEKMPYELDTKFNEGIVDYKMEQNITYNDPFDESKIGTIVTKKDTGVKSYFSEGFSSKDVTCDNSCVMRDKSAVGVVGGCLYIPYSESSSDNFGGAWTTWAPAMEIFDENIYQTQIEINGFVKSNGSGAWKGALIGLYKENSSNIADTPSDGMYIGLNAIDNTLSVFCGTKDDWKWPEGNVTVSLNNVKLGEKNKIQFLATQNRTVYVYINDVLSLTVKVDMTTDKVSVLNGNGKEVYNGNCDSDLLNGEYMSVFAHEGGIAIDKMSILVCTKGTKVVESTFTATPTEGNKLGLDITDKKDLVSICYSNWFDMINGSGDGPITGVSNVSELLQEYEFNSTYGFSKDGLGKETSNALHKFHYWAEPAQGYYRSSDRDAIKNNMTLLYKAGVDFIIIDYTYAAAPTYSPGTDVWKSMLWGPSEALLDTIMEMRSQGQGTPYVVFWINNDSLLNDMYKYFHSVEKWQDCFVYWNDKPFILKWSFKTADLENATWTIRGMYGLQAHTSFGQWSYLEIDNNNSICYDSEGNVEHMCADVATQETYMSKSTAHGRQGGKFWNGQWQNVFENHPKIVTVTWWNEWCAQLYNIDGAGYIFTDNFNQEYSRDIEPMKGGHGDQYYKWLCQYVKAYKLGKECPALYTE